MNRFANLLQLIAGFEHCLTHQLAMQLFDTACNSLCLLCLAMRHLMMSLIRWSVLQMILHVVWSLSTTVFGSSTRKDY